MAGALTLDEDIEAIEFRLGFAISEAYERFLQHPDIETVKGLLSMHLFILYRRVGSWT